MGDPTPVNTTMTNRGIWTICAIILLGAGMAATAVWYQHRIGRRCLEIWGVEGANLIRHARLVEAFRLAPPAKPHPSDATPAPAPTAARRPAEGETLSVGDQEFAVLDRLDISHARGLVHARYALIVDHHFESRLQDGSPPPAWQYALRFQEGDRQAVLVLDPVHNVVRLFPIDRGQKLRAETMRVETAFIEREFAEAGADRQRAATP